LYFKGLKAFYLFFAGFLRKVLKFYSISPALSIIILIGTATLFHEKGDSDSFFYLFHYGKKESLSPF